MHRQSRLQARQYIYAVQTDKQTALNLWALATLAKDQPSLRTYITNYLATQNRVSPSLSAFRNADASYDQQLRQLAFTTHSPFLLVAYLLAETDTEHRRTAVQQFTEQSPFPSNAWVHYGELTEALIEQKPITPRILNAEQFHPLHFLLFYETRLISGESVSANYIRTAAERWNQNKAYEYDGILRSLYVNTLFRSHYILDQYNQIASLYEPMTNDRSFPNSDLKLSIYRMLDYSMYKLGYYNRSISLVRNYNLPLSRYTNRPDLATKLEVDLGASLYEIGKIEESKQIYERIKAQADTSGDPISRARINNNLAINYWKSGDFDQYLDLQFKALNEAEQENDYNLRLDILKNLFVHYRINKDFNSAKYYLEQANELAMREQDNHDMAQLSYYEGQLYRDLESDYEQAIASFNHALDLISNATYYKSNQAILTEKALLFEQQKKYGRARDIYDTVIEHALERNDPATGTYTAFNKVNTYLKLGKSDSARIMMDTLATKNLDGLDFYQLVKARTVHANYLTHRDSYERGIQLLQPVIDQIVKRSRGSGDLETGFWQVEQEYLDAFELFVNLLIETGQNGKAVGVLDRLKTINDAALYQNALVRSKVLNDKELSQYKRLTEQLDELRKQLLVAAAGQKADIQQQIDELSAQKNALDQKITANANPEPVRVRDIQRRMDAHQRVLHITELNDQYYLATISRTDVAFKKIPLTGALRSQLDRSIAAMARGQTDLRELYSYTRLLGINTIPGHVNKLTIIPDSYLYQLPLSVMPLHEPAHRYSYGSASYIIERFEINYMTSLNDYNRSSSSGDYSYDYVGYGVSEFDAERPNLVPLPEAKTEINTIARQLTALSDKRVYLNADATEDAFRSAAPHSRILHLATHSEVANQDPMFSSIYLSRNPGGHSDNTRFPGRIFAYELFELNLANELVMLNSCESGSGSYLQGTGIVGLSRALRYAGAQSLVLNLWSVNDMMASEFAIKFYEGINRGLTKSNALRQAKLHFLKTKNANPHYWGSYMLLGDEQAIVQDRWLTNNIVATSFMLFFLSMAVASSVLELRRRKSPPAA